MRPGKDISEHYPVMIFGMETLSDEYTTHPMPNMWR
jgi:hypothetical protein